MLGSSWQDFVPSSWTLPTFDWSMLGEFGESAPLLPNRGLFGGGGRSIWARGCGGLRRAPPPCGAVAACPRGGRARIFQTHLGGRARPRQTLCDSSVSSPCRRPLLRTANPLAPSPPLIAAGWGPTFSWACPVSAMLATAPHRPSDLPRRLLLLTGRLCGGPRPGQPDRHLLHHGGCCLSGAGLARAARMRMGTHAPSCTCMLRPHAAPCNLHNSELSLCRPCAGPAGPAHLDGRC